MIRRILATTVKELLQLKRDWRTALALLAMPGIVALGIAVRPTPPPAETARAWVLPHAGDTTMGIVQGAPREDIPIWPIILLPHFRVN